MAKILVLGGGMIGSAMAEDLQQRGGAAVTVADRRDESLARVRSRSAAATVRADLEQPSLIRELVAPFDVVLGALPSAIGRRTLEAVIDAGKSYVDISFMPEDALELDAAARDRGVTVVVDCGVAPGVSNMMVGYAASRLEAAENVEIYVGGLPVQRQWPFDYKAGFAPHDVIEEYTRPARFVENGRIVTKEALSEPELIDFSGVGTLEAFNTDGLRTLLRTIGAPFMKEKTLRYPGHIELMKALRETGFFSKTGLLVAGQTVRPLDLTAAVLFPKWTFAEGEADLTVLRVLVEGRSGSSRERYSWDLLDYFDPQSGLRSMSRTTAFPAAIVASLVASHAFDRPGVQAPEAIGATPGLLDVVLHELRARGVECGGSVEVLEGEPTLAAGCVR